MPIYEYRCGACGFQNEYLQRMHDAPLTDCPECGKPAFTKLVSAAGFQLKGTGWYVTDFKNNGAKPAKKSDGSAEGSGKQGSGGEASQSSNEATCGAGACPACS